MTLYTRNGLADQRGGHLLGQGVYGCTFDPAPRCAGGSVFKSINGVPLVGKVTVEDITDELAIGKKIMALPAASAYFALPKEGCRPELPIKDADRRDCKVLEEAEKSDKVSMLLMPNAGEQLMKWSQNRKLLLSRYVDLFCHLLEGMIIYQNAGYVHNDIHMGNVLVDKHGVARYIDFGLAFRVSDVKKWTDANLGTNFRPKYVWQAPEVHAWRMMLNSVAIKDGVEQLKEINPEYIQLEHQFPKRLTAELALSDLIKKEVRNDGGDFVRKYAKQFDAWRIGLCFWFLWMDLLEMPETRTTNLYITGRHIIRDVLGGLTDFDPRTRWTAERALAAMDPKSKLLGLKK